MTHETFVLRVKPENWSVSRSHKARSRDLTGTSVWLSWGHHDPIKPFIQFEQRSWLVESLAFGQGLHQCVFSSLTSLWLMLARLILHKPLTGYYYWYWCLYYGFGPREHKKMDTVMIKASDEMCKCNFGGLCSSVKLIVYQLQLSSYRCEIAEDHQSIIAHFRYETTVSQLFTLH